MDLKNFDVDDCSYTYYCCIAFNKRDLAFIKKYMSNINFRKHMFFNMLFPSRPLYKYPSIYNEITEDYEYILYINKRKAFDKSHGIFVKKNGKFELLFYVNVTIATTNKLTETSFISDNTKITHTILGEVTSTIIHNISCDTDIKHIRVDKLGYREYKLHSYDEHYVKQLECKVKFTDENRSYSMLCNYLDIIRVEAIIRHYNYLEPDMCFIEYR